MAGLTEEQLDFFNTEGYLHVPDALQPEDLDPVPGVADGVEAGARF
tara:strand:+ start:294 stop:431 length:138 start_codon:yes stop_codon:yes gene_type:complete